MPNHPARDSSRPFQLEQAKEVLARTPAVLKEMLAGLSEGWIFNNYGPETWAPFDVIGHLIHGERTDWIPRLHIIFNHGTSRAFEPFDRYAQYEASKGKSIDELLETFAQLRKANLDELRSLDLTEPRLDREGIHPALGRVTARQLLATWVCHDLNHIHQVAKAMSYQYRNEVGAWRAYITILPGE